MQEKRYESVGDSGLNGNKIAKNSMAIEGEPREALS